MVEVLATQQARERLMRKIDYMNVWLADLKPALRPNEVVLVWGRQYRCSVERVGRTENYVLTPVESR